MSPRPSAVRRRLKVARFGWSALTDSRSVPETRGAVEYSGSGMWKKASDGAGGNCRRRLEPFELRVQNVGQARLEARVEGTTAARPARGRAVDEVEVVVAHAPSISFSVTSERGSAAMYRITCARE